MLCIGDKYTTLLLIIHQDKSVDPFVVYGDVYKKLRESMSGAMYGNQMEELGENTRVIL